MSERLRWLVVVGAFVVGTGLPLTDLPSGPLPLREGAAPCGTPQGVYVSLHSPEPGVPQPADFWAGGSVDPVAAQVFVWAVCGDWLDEEGEAYLVEAAVVPGEELGDWWAFFEDVPPGLCVVYAWARSGDVWGGTSVGVTVR